MKLERITLENFRQYYDRQRLTFAKDKNRNVTIIHGINGAGKTSLFTAINWCLYGEGIGNPVELISKEAISQTRKEESVRTSVEVVFLHEGERYIITRRLSAEKQKDGTVEIGSLDDFTMMRTRRDGQSQRAHNPETRMNSILPSNVRTYFLFDGEKIDNFAKPEASDEVRYVIYNVLKLEVLQRGRRHLEEVAADYRRELKRISSSELKELIEREEQALSEKEKSISRKEELEREVDSARRKIRDIEKRLGEMQSTRSLQQRREELENQLREREDQKDKLVNSIRDLAISGYIMVAQPAVDRALAILDEKRERGEIPSNVRQQFVQDLIERMRCICGRDFKENGAEHKRLLALMKSSLSGSLEDDILDTAAALRPFAERGQRLRDDLSKAMAERARLKEIIDRLDEEITDLGTKLKGSPQEQIRNLEKQRQDFLADIESCRSDQGGLDMRIEFLSRQLEELKKQIQQAKKEKSAERLLTRKAEIAQNAADAIAEIYETFADDMRRRIEGKTKEIFKLLIWKDAHFKDVQLGPDYNLQVIDRYGQPARPDLSAGERQVLSLSFITAISRVSEEEAPLVMDTPFGRLSSHHRNSITKHLPELADQLVLFVTDEELRDQARKNLEKKIGAEYQLEFDRRTSCTEIIEVK